MTEPSEKEIEETRALIRDCRKLADKMFKLDTIEDKSRKFHEEIDSILSVVAEGATLTKIKQEAMDYINDNKDTIIISMSDKKNQDTAMVVAREVLSKYGL